MDVVVHLPSNLTALDGGDYPTGVAVRLGGSACNAAIRRSTSDTSGDVIGGVGTDALGAFVIAELASRSVGTEWLQESGVTGTVVVMSSADAQRTMFHDPHACNVLPQRMPKERWRVLATNARYLVGDGNAHVSPWLVDSTGTCLIVDLADLAGHEELVWSEVLHLAGSVPRFVATGGSLSVDELRVRGPFSDFPWIVETRGERSVRIWSHGDLVAKSPVSAIHDVDATGAGDAFVGGLARGLLQSSVPAAARAGVANARRLLKSRASSAAE